MKHVNALVSILTIVALALFGVVLTSPVEAAEDSVTLNLVAPETEGLQSVDEAPLDLTLDIVICDKDTCICFDCSTPGDCKRVPPPFPCTPI